MEFSEFIANGTLRESPVEDSEYYYGIDNLIQRGAAQFFNEAEGVFKVVRSRPLSSELWARRDGELFISERLIPLTSANDPSAPTNRGRLLQGRKSGPIESVRSYRAWKPSNPIRSRNFQTGRHNIHHKRIRDVFNRHPQLQLSQTTG